MLYRSVLVPEILGKIDGTLDYFGRILRKELFAASRNMGQDVYKRQGENFGKGLV